MFAYVQFLCDKIKAVVPVKDIKNFESDSFEIDSFRIHEVFWKSPNGEGTGYWYAVVLLVAETEELIEQRKKRIRLPTAKKLEELLAAALENNTKKMGDDEMRRKTKEIMEKRSICEKEKLKNILNSKLQQKKRSVLHLDGNIREPSSSKMQRRGSSASDSSDGDELVLKSELKNMKVEYEKVLRKLKLKQDENIQLKKRNDQLQELNINLQTRLLSLLNANDSLVQNVATTQKVPDPVTAVKHLPKNRVESEGGTLLVDNLPKEKNNNSLSIHHCNENKEKILEETSAPTLEEIAGSHSHVVVSSPNADEINCDPDDLLKWKDDQLELAPGISISKEKWLKVISGKNMNASRLTRNLAVSLWGSETLKDRSVTGAACKRFLKDGILAKQALTPIKVDAVQNGLRFWLRQHEGKEEEEVAKLSSSTVVRKLLANKIMDLSKTQKKDSSILA